ncbi:DUF3597 family protein [Pseudomonas sp. NPDC088368]|uniref:DUF3597 family protein n=1 Tax=Pseudomonas sp. NPDC088368 TaxID=3364453 RepID=UPI003826808E
MSIISSILEKLGFGTANASTQASPDAPTAPATGSAPPSPGVSSQPTPDQLNAEITKLKEGNPGLNPQSSIVDLLKALKLDSSMENRKKLAEEVGISSYEGTAEQNIELHKAVLNKATQG